MATGKQGQDLSGIHSWLVLWRASHSVGEIARNDIAMRGLGISDFGVLEALLHRGPQPVNEIGKRVLLTSGSMTAAINRLQNKGFVTRKDHPTDHRTWVVHLTASGRRWIEKAFAGHAKRMEAAFSPLDTRERAALQALLKKLGNADGGVLPDGNAASSHGPVSLSQPV